LVGKGRIILEFIK